MTRRAIISEIDRWLEDAAVPVLVFILFALFTRGLPWILAMMAHG